MSEVYVGPSTQAPTPHVSPEKSLGAFLLDTNRTLFRVWAPLVERIEVHLTAPRDRRVPLDRDADGYHQAIVDDCPAGTRYLFVLDGAKERPDPASRSQPGGVHAPSEVVSVEFDWHDQQWRGIPLEEYVIYELHVGTFTDGGTFEAIIPRLEELAELGITAIELMPIAQFPGSRNWGYDGVYINAAQMSYGGVQGLKRLVDAAHDRGLAVILDVVYNHLGPEGNYLADFAPYFTDRYKTPWGSAINFDGPHSDDVRWFFIHNALMWTSEFHLDGLRVDAVHAIHDRSAEPFLQDLTSAVREYAESAGRRVYSFAESNLNDPRVIAARNSFGLGFDSQWNDDFHHSLHTLLTGESDGYYLGFGKASDLTRVLTSGYLWTGQHNAYRRRKYGAKPNTSDGSKFVAFAQNHDQVGNRMMGDRLAALVSYEKLRLAAAAVVLSPFIPMLFMGEEYGEKEPFQYFTSHSDADLIEAVRKGRFEEFASFGWQGEPPDPHDEETFLSSKLRWQRAQHGEHATLRRLYGELLRLRRSTLALRSLDLAAVEAHADDGRKLVLMKRRAGHEQVLIALSFSEKTEILDLPFGPAGWTSMIDTGAKLEENRITLPPLAFALYRAAVE